MIDNCNEYIYTCLNIAENTIVKLYIYISVMIDLLK